MRGKKEDLKKEDFLLIPLQGHLDKAQEVFICAELKKAYDQNLIPELVITSSSALMSSYLGVKNAMDIFHGEGRPVLTTALHRVCDLPTYILASGTKGERRGDETFYLSPFVYPGTLRDADEADWAESLAIAERESPLIAEELLSHDWTCANFLKTWTPRVGEKLAILLLKIILFAQGKRSSELVVGMSERDIHIKILERCLVRTLSDLTALSLEEAEDWFSNQSRGFLTAEECLKAGFIDDLF